MTVELLIALATLLVEHEHLLAANGIVQYFNDNFCTFNHGCARSGQPHGIAHLRPLLPEGVGRQQAPSAREREICGIEYAKQHIRVC